jgi:hypothetical protein
MSARPGRQPAEPAPTGIWLGASYVLGRDVPADGPYPHIDGRIITGRMTGVEVRLTRRDCAACHVLPPRKAATIHHPTGPDAMALSAGDHDLED